MTILLDSTIVSVKNNTILVYCLESVKAYFKSN